MSEECRFARGSGPAALAGLRAGTLAELAAGLRDRHPGHGLAAADLSLGGWRPHQAATEVCGQLGLELPPAGAPPPATGGAENVARLIDRETAGDDAVRAALIAAARVRRRADEGAGPLAVCVLAPRFGAGWARADAAFVRALAQALDDSPHRVVLASPDGDAPPPEGCTVAWAGTAAARAPAPAGDPVGLIPGVVALAELPAFAAAGPRPALPLPGGRVLLGPELRPDPRSLPRAAFDPLVDAAGRMPWLAAYAHFHAGERADRWRLYREACARFGLDAPRLLARCTALARSDGERALFTAVAQGARIAAREFADAAAANGAGPDVSRELRAFLEEARGWALCMCDRPAEAEAHLAAARELLAGEAASEARLFLLNISALNRLKLGDAAGALALEREILRRRRGGGGALGYVNALNLGRLHRRAGRPEVAERWLRIALATADGLRSESDAVYGDASLAQLAEARGRPAEAFRAWLGAALVWAASPAPEAIGTRAAAAAGGPGLDRVAEHLLARLHATAAGADRAALDAPPRPAPAFARPGCAAAPDRAVLAGDVGVLAAPESVAPVPGSAAAEALRAGLAAVLAARDGSLAGAGTVIVDDRLGRGLPATRAELAGVALRLGVRRLHAGEADLPVCLGPGVAALRPRGAGAVVTFRRYRPDLVLSAPAAALATRAAGERPPRLGEAPELIRALEGERVLVVADPA